MDPISKMFTTVKLQQSGGGADKLSEKDLREMLTNPKLTDKAKAALVDELTKRAEAKISSGKGTDQDARLLQLLPKLVEGTLTTSENSELGELLGVELPGVPEKPGQGNI